MIGFLKRWWKSLNGTDESVLRTIERIREHADLGARRLEIPYDDWWELLEYLDDHQRFIPALDTKEGTLTLCGVQVVRKDRE